MGQVWLQRLMKFDSWRKQTFKDRYARFDEINKTLAAIAIISWMLNRFLPMSAGNILALLALGGFVWRFLSKRIYPRLNENQKYIRWCQKIQQKVKAKDFSFSLKRKKTSKNAIQYVYFACPNCKQNLRVPYGKGNIRVTCSKCRTKFERKV